MMVYKVEGSPCPHQSVLRFASWAGNGDGWKGCHEEVGMEKVEPRSSVHFSMADDSLLANIRPLLLLETCQRVWLIIQNVWIQGDESNHNRQLFSLVLKLQLIRKCCLQIYIKRNIGSFKKKNPKTQAETSWWIAQQQHYSCEAAFIACQRWSGAEI